MRGGAFGGNAAQQQNSLGQHQFGHRAGVRKRRIEHRNTAFTGGVQVNLVGANAKAADRRQLVGTSENVSGELGAGTNPDEMRIGNFGQQRRALQRAADAFDVAVAGGLQ